MPAPQFPAIFQTETKLERFPSARMLWRFAQGTLFKGKTL